MRAPTTAPHASSEQASTRGGALAVGRQRYSKFVPVALFVLLAVALLWPALPGGGKVMAAEDLLEFSPPFHEFRPADRVQASNSHLYDSVYVFHPDQLFARDVLRSGDLPVWNNLSGAGQPLLAQQQSAPLYPGTLLTFLLPYWESLGLVAALKLVVAALGTYLLGRALGLGRLSALLAGSAFAFGTYMVTWLEHPHSNSYVLLPWLMLLVERVTREARIRDALALGCVGGLALLGGHPQSVMIIALPALALAAWRLAEPREHGEPSPPRGRALALLGGASVLSLLFGAVMLVPFAEVISESYNTDRPNSAFANNMLYGFLFPEFWGRPDKFLLLGGTASYPERTAYIGVVPMILAVAGLVSRSRSRDQLFLAGVAALTLATVLDTPLFDLAMELPGLRSITFARMIIIVALCGSLLAGFGLQRLIDGDTRDRKRILVAVLVIILLAPLPWVVQQGVPMGELGGALAELPDLGIEPKTAEVVQFSAVLRWVMFGLLGAGLCFLALRSPRALVVAAAVLVGITALDLVTLNRGYNPAVEKSTVEPPVPAAVSYMNEAQADGRIAADGEALGPNTGTRYGLRDVRHHGLPLVERYSRLWTGLGGWGFQRALLLPDASTAPVALDLFGVNHVLSPARGAGGGIPGPLVFNGQGGPVVLNSNTLPRAYAAYGWHRATDLSSGVAAIASRGAQQVRDAPLVEGLPSRRSERPATPARVVRETPTEISVRVRAEREALLVLGDNYYPGWRAYVNGRERNIHPANVAFRAVRVPPGEHLVRFAYEPGSVRLGLLLTGLGVVITIGIAVGMLLRRRRRS